MSEEKLVPKLRFREFSDMSFKKVKIEDIFNKVRNGFVGVATPYYVENGIPYLQSNNVRRNRLDKTHMVFINQEFHKKHEKSMLKENDILMVQSGHAGECAVVPKNLEGSNCHALIIMTPQDLTTINSTYCAYYLNSPTGIKQIFPLITGNTVKHILASELKKMTINLPSFNEQNKVADFITSIDKKIDFLNKKHQDFQEFKKYLLQNIFSQKLRFDNQKWEIKKIGDIFDERSEKGFDDLELLSVTINKGVIKRSEIEDKDNSSDNKSNYKHVLPGDIVYNSMRMWQGASGVSDFEGIVSPAYTILTPSVELNPKFFGYYFKTHKMLHQFTKYSQGLTSDTWNLKYPLISEISIKIPSINEQNEFTNFLSIIDKKISTIQKEINQVEVFKKGLLQQMFV